jgi:hypothetical protein
MLAESRSLRRKLVRHLQADMAYGLGVGVGFRLHQTVDLLAMEDHSIRLMRILRRGDNGAIHRGDMLCSSRRFIHRTHASLAQQKTVKQCDEE